ncbi:TetR/AcrR family transcriptional regulator [Alkalibacter mobilis]|uniref:TetR/AcrR family transcriptional regulator n=1 Tax=Alkalibacter mobilis TaxID=2787712 RepID=UPI0018A07373|nr:TetR/AcrR family transcriptional regulator [Alkalibacter mobilis]MBF7095613.1 TetR/AcrR family transcriptional regulator [Alkalibacter mobilis]
MAQNNLKESILNEAKNLFYENGYEKTTARMIAKEVSMHHSNIFYYFTNKRAILKEIFRNYFKCLHDQVMNLKIELPDTEILLFYVYIVLKNIQIDEKFKRLFYESTDVVIEVLFEDFIVHLYPKIDSKADEQKSEIKQKEYFMDLVVILSSEKQLEYYRRNKIFEISDDEVRDYYSRLNLKLLNIDEDTIEKSLKNIDKYVNKIDFSKLNIFDSEKKILPLD